MDNLSDYAAAPTIVTTWRSKRKRIVLWMR